MEYQQWKHCKMHQTETWFEVFPWQHKFMDDHESLKCDRHPGLTATALNEDFERQMLEVVFSVSHQIAEIMAEKVGILVVNYHTMRNED
jgi:hypothetical protein